jgi:flagellar basal-body rod protein FlgG
MRLLGTAASGLRAQQAAMDTVGNNIANVNTPGYKTNRMEFSEALASELRSEEATSNGEPVGERISVGAGVIYNAISTDFRQGTLMDSQNPLDMGIDGEGFFPIRMVNGQSGYTRVGNFQTDAQGRLVNANGQMLELRIPAEVTDLSVDLEGRITGDLNGEQKVFGRIVPQTPEDDLMGDFFGMIQTDELGRVVDGNGEILPVALIVPEGASEISVSSDGTVSGSINGTREEFGRVTITAFTNPGGLEKVGDNLFVIPNSPGVAGTEFVGIPGSQVQERTLGQIRSNALEQSNVDLGTAMTDLIQVQRAYQMNARMITNGDQMWSIANSLRR